MVQVEVAYNLEEYMYVILTGQSKTSNANNNTQWKFIINYFLPN